MVKISIIVPVYNVKEYLERCLNSLINQTLKDIEIIVIDDGSTDGSQEILLKYKKRITLITQKNKGVATARNRGLDVARGEYIAFVDSDDWVDLDMYKNMYRKAKEKNYDMVMCNFKYVDDKREWSGQCDFSNDVINIEDKKKYMISMFPVLWNKIYKKEKIDKLRFKDGVWAEDVEYLYRVLPNINTIGYLNQENYYYFQREKSESRLFDKRVYYYVENFNNIIEYYKKNQIYNLYEKELEYCYVRYLYATFIKRAASFENNVEYKKAVNTAINNVKEKFPKYRKNLYFYKNTKGIYLVCFNRLIANIYYKLNKIVH